MSDRAEFIKKTEYLRWLLTLVTGSKVAFTLADPQEALEGVVIQRHRQSAKIIVKDADGLIRSFSSVNGRLRTKTSFDYSDNDQSYKLIPLEESKELIERRIMMDKIRGVDYTKLSKETLEQILRLIYPDSLETPPESP